MSQRTLLNFVCLLIAYAPLFGADRESDWPCWRGPNRDGIANSNQEPPTEWSDTQNIAWKVPIPGRGHGSVTVVGEQIFLPTADEQLQVQSVLCFDRKSGKKLWQTEVHRGPLNFKNKKASQASGTIACDGERIFVNFLNDGVAYTTALSRDGKKLWQQKISDYIVHQGYGSSPTIYQSLVIVSADNKGGGAIVAFHRETGKEVWRQSRPKTPNYPSPVVLHTSGRDQLLMSGCDLVSGFDPLSGEKLWEVSGAATECVTTAVTDGKLTFTSGGYPRNHISAVRTDGSGKVAWENTTRVYVPSMIVRDGYLYAVADAGIASCWKCETGRNMWSHRLMGTFSASPVLVGDRLYAINEDGTTFILEVSPEKVKLLAENKLNAEVFATPTICDSRIYLRGGVEESGKRQEYLYCVGQRGT